MILKSLRIVFPAVLALVVLSLSSAGAELCGSYEACTDQADIARKNKDYKKAVDYMRRANDFVRKRTSKYSYTNYTEDGRFNYKKWIDEENARDLDSYRLRKIWKKEDVINYRLAVLKKLQADRYQEKGMYDAVISGAVYSIRKYDCCFDYLERNADKCSDWMYRDCRRKGNPLEYLEKNADDFDVIGLLVQGKAYAGKWDLEAAIFHFNEAQKLGYKNIFNYDILKMDFDYFCDLMGLPDGCFDGVGDSKAEVERLCKKYLDRVYLYRGQAYLLKGDYDSAISDFNKAVEPGIDPLKADVGLAMAYVALRDPENAINNIEIAQDHFSDESEYDDYFKSAIDVVYDSIDDEGGFRDPEEIAGTASDSYDEKDYVKAVVYYLAHSMLEPDHAVTAYNLAMCYQKLENKVKTIDYLYRYLYLEPEADDREEIQELIDELSG